ncbi:MAG: DUF58 domain-containing protein [Anaerolineae bacterium]|nr:DUF58 domain-containing protein [Thermoflexus sp.]MDW8064132.1 DUF58 domain-containing protein [Anaerolineae bacterium]
MTALPPWLQLQSSSPEQPTFRWTLRPRAKGLLLLTVIVGLTATITGRSILYHLTYMLLALFILSFLWAWSAVRDLEIQRIPRSRRNHIGGLFEETLILRNTSFLPKIWLEIRDASTLPGHRASFVLHNLGIGGERLWTVRTHCHRRGRYRLGPLTLIGTDPFGLFEATLQLRETDEVLIYPPIFPLSRLGLPVDLWQGGRAVQRRTTEATPNAGGVREYQPGDAFCRIHWPSTARRERFMVKEFDQEPAGKVWIVLDLMADAHFHRPDRNEEEQPAEKPRLLPLSTEEYAIALAASIAAYLLQHDRIVGILASGSRQFILPPHRGRSHLERLLEGLALLRADGKIPLDQTLQSPMLQTARGSLLMLITPSGDPRWVIAARNLRAHGIRTAAIVLEVASFGGPKILHRILPLLEGSGIPSVAVRAGEPFPMTLERLGSA